MYILDDFSRIKVKEWGNLSIKLVIQGNIKCVQEMWRFLR